MALIKEEEYKGSPMLVIAESEETRYPFNFGLRKAKLVVEHAEDVRAFVIKHDPEWAKLAGLSVETNIPDEAPVTTPAPEAVKKPKKTAAKK